MRKRIFQKGLVIGLVLGAVSCGQKRSAPPLDRQKLEQAMLSVVWNEKVQQAEDYFLKGGTNAVPILLHLMDRLDQLERKGKQGEVNVLGGRLTEVIQKMGPESLWPFREEFVQRFRAGKTPFCCAAALAVLDQGYEREILTGRMNRRSRVRAAAAWWAGEIGNRPEWTTQAVDCLIKLAEDQSVLVQDAAISSLGKLGKMGDRVLPVLIRCLQETTNQVTKCVTIQAIRGFGKEAAAYREQFKSILGKEKDPVAKRMLQELIESLKEKEEKKAIGKG